MERYHCGENGVLYTHENIKPKFDPELIFNSQSFFKNISSKTRLLDPSEHFQIRIRKKIDEAGDWFFFLVFLLF